MGFYIVHNDIVNMEKDAFVNAANSALEMGGGGCGAVFRAAGVKELQEECRKKAPCPTGKAVLTAGYGLKARYIIHVVGPVWKNGEAGEEKQLRMSYRSALKLAEDCGCQSVAFPLISSGLEMAGKIVIAATLVPWLGYTGVIICEPIVWFIMVIPLLIQTFRMPVLRTEKTDGKI